MSEQEKSEGRDRGDEMNRCEFTGATAAAAAGLTRRNLLKTVAPRLASRRIFRP